MNNTKDNSKIVVAALLVALVAEGVIMGKMLLENEWDIMRYRYAIDQKNERLSELMAKIHDYEWRLKQHGEEP